MPFQTFVCRNQIKIILNSSASKRKTPWKKFRFGLGTWMKCIYPSIFHSCKAKAIIELEVNCCVHVKKKRSIWVLFCCCSQVLFQHFDAPNGMSSIVGVSSRSELNENREKKSWHFNHFRVAFFVHLFVFLFFACMCA